MNEVQVIIAIIVYVVVTTLWFSWFIKELDDGLSATLAGLMWPLTSLGILLCLVHEVVKTRWFTFQVRRTNGCKVKRLGMYHELLTSVAKSRWAQHDAHLIDVIIKFDKMNKKET